MVNASIGVLNPNGNKGFGTTLVGGGGKINSSFIKEKLIDEIYLDVIPIILSEGTKLFSSMDFEANLELVETKNLSNGEAILHYRVKP